MYGPGPVGRELVGSEAVQRSRSEAGRCLDLADNLRSRLLHLDIRRSLYIMNSGIRRA